LKRDEWEKRQRTGAVQNLAETGAPSVRYFDMKVALLIVFVVAFVVVNAWSAMLFKFAADYSGKKALWYYVLGNLIAALGPLALTLALKRSNPNIIYAVCYGASFAAIQIAASRLFHQPLSTFQWAGIASVGLGICLLQFGQK